MTDAELIEQMAIAMRVDVMFGDAKLEFWHGIATAALAIAKPVIRKQALEEFAKIVKEQEALWNSK